MNRLNWIRKGLLIKPDKNKYWMKTHCMIPTPYKISENIYRIYYSGRDENNRSHIGFSTIDLSKNCEIVDTSNKPILCPGELGCFDDNGVTPSCIIKLNSNELALYYIGWNPGSTTRMHIYGGLAISTDNGKTFKRWSKAPIIERTKSDPYINTAPWVVKKKHNFIMYYVSGIEWLSKDLPRYNIKIGTSNDGKHWKRDGTVCIDFKNKNENALARPYVIYDDFKWKMWFAFKGKNYEIGYAESKDGHNWQRLDNVNTLSKGKSSFENEMVEYAAVINHKNKYFMFYNGNNYGIDGICLAVSHE